MTTATRTPLERDLRLQEILHDHQAEDGALLPILHAVQAEFGYIPPEVLPAISEALLLSKAELQGVLSFYHDFRQSPPQGHVVKLCRAESCQTVGGTELAAALQQRFGVGWHKTSPDGRLTLEPVYCFGLCGAGPAGMVGGRLVGRLDWPQLQRLIEALP